MPLKSVQLTTEPIQPPGKRGFESLRTIWREVGGQCGLDDGSLRYTAS
ncbi:hypothetical protein NVSP9465_01475 [Novosphingobium sp. CECT 9465]|nr:hypothetical protein NVSP9465_01475 [Novosphingobium sp. CECT 9465]